MEGDSEGGNKGEEGAYEKGVVMDAEDTYMA